MNNLVGLSLGIALLPAIASAQERKSGPLPDLGRQWKVHQWILPSADLEGRWTRIGKSNTFDVSYTNAVTGQFVYSKVTVVSRTARQIVLSIDGTRVKMVGTINQDGRTIRGRLEPCAPTKSCGWTAETDWQPPAAEAARQREATRALTLDDLGYTWRVHDFTTEGYDYYGTWTIPKDGETIEFTYKDRKDGSTARGSLVWGGMSGRNVTVFHQGRRKYMRGVVQPDGKTIKGTADWCTDAIRCGWEATAGR